MVSSELEKTRLEAMRYANIKCMPLNIKDRQGCWWIKALGIVRKVNMLRSYAILEQDVDGIKIKHLFGSQAQVVAIEEIFPYEEMERRFIPKLKSDEDTVRFLYREYQDEEGLRALLSSEGKTIEEVKRDRQTIRNLVLRLAIKYGKETVTDESRYRREYERKEKQRSYKRKQGVTKSVSRTPRRKRGQGTNEEES